VIILYWKVIKETLVNFFPQKVGYEKSGFKFWFMIFIACIPGVIVKLLLDDVVDTYLFTPVSVAITLFLGGIWIIYAEKKFRNNNLKGQQINVTARQALIIGLFQCLAVIPGMSRSASIIVPPAVNQKSQRILLIKPELQISFYIPQTPS
jgi:undecaprenyl-diphosphatase